MGDFLAICRETYLAGHPEDRRDEETEAWFRGEGPQPKHPDHSKPKVRSKPSVFKKDRLDKYLDRIVGSEGQFGHKIGYEGQFST